MHPAAAAVVPVETFTVEAKFPAEAADHLATMAQPPPTPEQIRAVEAAFAQEKESEMAMGLLGMWTSAAMLRNLALEHFSQSEDEEEEDEEAGADEEEPEEGPR